MTPPRFDVRPFLRRDEGQHFDRKSLFEGPPGAKRPRDRREVRDQVAEYVAAFANAEGGVLVLGIEDDFEITGHRFPPRALASLLATPGARLSPPQADGFVVEAEGEELVVFDASTADAPVQVVGNGFPLRVGDRTVQASETQIRAMKLAGLAESWESRPSPCSLEELDSSLIARAKAGAGLGARRDEEYLLQRKLADRRGRGLVLRRAAELLFSRSGPDHPNAGVRILRVIGRRQRTGANHNVEERPRIETNLPSALAEARSQVAGFLRRPSRLVGARFLEAPEYPDFAWQEALVNAVAHRDYGVEGASNEVWLYDDRMEVISPGRLPDDLTLDHLLRFERRARSRNPRIVRVLVDLGEMRDRGEGVPRMFAEMEDAFLPPPEIEADRLAFTVTLRNATAPSREDHRFLSGLGPVDLSREELRVLLHAHRRGGVDAAEVRRFAGLDTPGAERLLRSLGDRDLLSPRERDGDRCYELSGALAARVGRRPDGGPGGASRPSPDDRGSDRGPTGAEREGFDADRGEPGDGSSPAAGADRVEEEGISTRGFRAAEAAPDLPAPLEAALGALGPRPRKERLRPLILGICGARDWTTADDLARRFRFRPKNLTRRHLGPMVAEGLLEHRYPDRPHHPRQAYRARGARPAEESAGETGR